MTVDPSGMEKLLRSHEAVFIASGADAHRPLNTPGEKLDGVVAGLDFLRQAPLQIRAENAEVVVIGGGNTALDAARTALRAGARSVTVVYRRTLDEMPAFADEIAEAAAEGVRFKLLAAPVAFIGSKRLKAVRLVHLKLAEPEADGRPRPVPVEGDPEELACDVAIIAAGQKPDDLFLGSALRWEADHIWVDAWHRTSQSGIFAGGDVTPAKASVVDAMATGKRAALGIHLTVAGRLNDTALKAVTLGSGPAFSITACFQGPENRLLDQVAVPDKLTMYMTPFQPPETLPEADAGERVRTGGEVTRGLSAETAVKEAARCLVCGTCVGCNRCLTFCPEGAVIPPENPGDEYLYRNEFCKGCGVCASVCLRGVMEPGGDR
jgi:NADPH-dependent glutamate synthase beta subunit-like oxidoreductase